MSLYYVQKFLYQLNRDSQLQEQYWADRRAVLAPYELTEEEIAMKFAKIEVLYSAADIILSCRFVEGD